MDVDDLLKELGDLAPTTTSASPAAKLSAAAAAAAAAPSHHAHARAKSSGAAATSYSSAPSSATPHPPSSVRPAASSATPIRHAASAKTDLDALLDDIDKLDLPSTGGGRKATGSMAGTSAALPVPPSGSAPRLSAGPAPKCMGLFIGGSRKQRGRNGSVVGAVVCCDSLRCTKCDFRVSWFRDCAWDDSVDYLFFRNNFPTESKLSPKLVNAPGTCAYCCQCSWQSPLQETLVDFGGDLRWVCGGHAAET